MTGTIVFVITIGAILIAVLGLWLFGERGRLMQPSTREMIRLGGFNFNFLHFYVYGRWTNQYIGTAVRMMRPPKETDEPATGDHYHGKVLPLELAEALVTVNEDIPLQDLEQIIPYAMARDLVLAAPPDIVIYECGCRHARENPCEPTDVCMVIGKPFTDFVLEHNPRTSRRITQEEALTILREEHERGHMHTAYFKDACLERFYAICNCCSCCCGGYQATVYGGIPMMSSSGYVAEVDAGLCQACGTCEGVCPFDAIQAHGMAIVKWEACMGCGVCVGQCPEGAITLVPDERKGIPLDMRVLPKQATMS